MVCCSTNSYFYPRPPRGGRPVPDAPRLTLTRFLSTPSARRATSHRRFTMLPEKISIHALREEGDRHPCRQSSCWQYFYPRPPRGGRHCLPWRGSNGHRNFYPRPPRGGRPAIQDYIHAAHLFLSTPSARRATGIFSTTRSTGFISIHALREEGDRPPLPLSVR